MRQSNYTIIITCFLLLPLLIEHQLKTETAISKIAAQTSLEKVPVPYTSSEFSPALQDLYRFETVFFGTLPLTILLSSFVYDITNTGENNNIFYTPSWDTDSIWPKALISISLSTVLALLDLGIHIKKTRGNNKHHEITLASHVSPEPTQSRSQKTQQDPEKIYIPTR